MEGVAVDEGDSRGRVHASAFERAGDQDSVGLLVADTGSWAVQCARASGCDSDTLCLLVLVGEVPALDALHRAW